MYNNEYMDNRGYSHDITYGLSQTGPADASAKIEAQPSLHDIINSCYNNAQAIDSLASVIQAKLIGSPVSNCGENPKSEPITLEAKLIALDNLLTDTKTLLAILNERI